MLQVVAGRTRHVRLVVQDVHDPHNVSACMRSADAFGVQDVDVVTLTEPFRPTTVARGVDGWLTLRKHHTIADCVKALRQDGYKIVVGVPAPDAFPLPDLPIEDRVAVVFGNEHAGVHADWLEVADLRFTIPMVGMVESLNISVSAAVTLFTLTQKARTTIPPERYFLSETERQELLNEWACRQVPNHEQELARLRG